MGLCSSIQELESIGVCWRIVVGRWQWTKGQKPDDETVPSDGRKNCGRFYINFGDNKCLQKITRQSVHGEINQNKEMSVKMFHFITVT